MPVFGKRVEPRTTAAGVRMHWPIVVWIISMSCIAIVVGQIPVVNDLGTTAGCTATTRPRRLFGSGTLTSPGFPENYFNDGDCQWLLMSSYPSGSISLTIYDFVSESIYDKLYLYDGSSSSASLIASLSGNPSVPNTYTSTGRFMFVRFVTDRNRVFQGFHATYESKDCAPGFIRINAVNSCYKPVAMASTWDEAASSCQSLHPNSHLAFIDSSQEQQAVASLLTRYNDPVCINPAFGRDYRNGWWIGFRRSNRVTSSFVAMSGPSERYNQNAMSYFNWMPREPSNYDSLEVCVYMAGVSSFQWDDTRCNERLCYVCEYDLQ